MSCGNSKFASRTSTSVTSAPSERNALATPCPVASETSRSEPGPPIKTAIFFVQDSDHVVFPHDLDFGFQLDAALCARAAVFDSCRSIPALRPRSRRLR